MRQPPHPSWVWVQVYALVAAAFFAVVAGATHDAAVASAEVPAGAVSPADAQRTYQADCAVCHGAAGRGTAAGPPIVGAGRASVDYYLTTGRMPLVSQAGREPVSRSEQPLPGVQLADPTATPHRRHPAYPPEMIAALVEYVHDFGAGGPDVPVVHPGAALRA